jgi:hypothetical protein
MRTHFFSARARVCVCVRACVCVGGGRVLVYSVNLGKISLIFPCQPGRCCQPTDDLGLNNTVLYEQSDAKQEVEISKTVGTQCLTGNVEKVFNVLS